MGEFLLTTYTNMGPMQPVMVNILRAVGKEDTEGTTDFFTNLANVVDEMTMSDSQYALANVLFAVEHQYDGTTQSRRCVSTLMEELLDEAFEHYRTPDQVRER
jgi:hypothetical protein